MMNKKSDDHETVGLIAARLGFGPAVLHRTFDALSVKRIRRLYKEEHLPMSKNGNRIRSKPVHLFAGVRDESNTAKRMACTFLACVYERLKADCRARDATDAVRTDSHEKETVVPDLCLVYLSYRISRQMLRFFEPDEAFLLVESMENKKIFLERCRCGYPILLNNVPVFTHETKLRKPLFHCPWCDEHGPLYGAFLEVKLQRHSEWIGHTDRAQRPVRQALPKRKSERKA